MFKMLGTSEGLRHVSKFEKFEYGEFIMDKARNQCVGEVLRDAVIAMIWQRFSGYGMLIMREPGTFNG